MAGLSQKEKVVGKLLEDITLSTNDKAIKKAIGNYLIFLQDNSSF